MPFVKAQCTNCGAYLKVDNSRDAAICEYCGTPYVVEKAIHKYNVTNNIKANTVNIYGGANNNFDIRAGKLIRYNGASTRVMIDPDITAIGEKAFAGCSELKSVIIPYGVKKIEFRAFSGCSGLTSIEIPASVTYIGEGAFAGCSGLTSINIPNSVTVIDYGAFDSCSGLTSITLPNKLKIIRGNMLYGCTKLKRLDIPNSVNTIENYAFKNCSSLISLKLPNNISEIGDNIVKGCNRLENIYCDNLDLVLNKYFNRLYGSLFYETIKDRRERHVCQHCGGRLKGFFTEKCTKCGKVRDYQVQSS